MTLSAPYRVLLVDDHVLFREGLVRLLESETDFLVAGRAAGVQEALEVLSGCQVDLILLDYDLGSERATDLITKTREAGFAGRVLIVTAGVSEQESVTLIRLGVAGIFHKHNPPEALCKCLRQISAGQVWLERDYLRPLFSAVDTANSTPSPALTEKEKKVLRCVFQGLGNKEIAEKLVTSETSVKGILQQLFHKTGVRTRSQLVRVALEQWQDQL